MSSRKFIDLCRAAAYRQNAYGERARVDALVCALIGLAIPRLPYDLTIDQ